MNKLLRLRRGVTAMELLVVLGLFSVLTTGLMSLLGTAMEQWNRGTGKSEADEVASLISQSIVRQIEDGKSAASVSGGLEVQMPGVNDQGDYERSTDGDVVRLSVTGTTLYRKVNGGSAKSLATGVQSFTYTLGADNVTFTLVISRQSGTRTSQTSFTQRVTLRNYVAP